MFDELFEKMDDNLRNQILNDISLKLKESGVDVTLLCAPYIREKFSSDGIHMTFVVASYGVTGVQLDFSKHDKKVMESAQKYIDKLKTENEALRKQVENLDKQNTDIQDSHMKLYNDSKDEIRELEAEIQRLREKCCEVARDSAKIHVSDCGTDYEKLCCELQDQHQQDCITINQLHVTIDKLVDRYANLRKNVGMD